MSASQIDPAFMEKDDVLGQIAAWTSAGRPAALATVVETWGSSPRPVGSLLGVAGDGVMIGSVSGGCVEGAVVTQALETIETGAPKMMQFGVSDASAWEVGLACGGRISVWVERVG